jgi:hypothetical protein
LIPEKEMLQTIRPWPGQMDKSFVSDQVEFEIGANITKILEFIKMNLSSTIPHPMSEHQNFQ